MGAPRVAAVDPSTSRRVSRARPLSVFHFANPRHWTVRDVRRAMDQGTQALMDDVVLLGYRLSRTHRSSEELTRQRHLAEQALEVYDRAGWIDDPSRAYPAQRAPAKRDVTLAPEKAGGVDYQHLTFPSAYNPRSDDPARDHWLGMERNKTVHAWVLRHPEPRPWVVGVHGAEMGRPAMDLRIFRAAWLHHKLGLNVALPILPLHGPRKESGPDAHFPTEEITNNVHGMLQAVADVRRTIAWIRQQDPGQQIALHGISMGGYTSAIVASTEDDLDCAILGVAPMDIVLLMERHHGTGSGYDLRVQNFEVGAKIAPMISPLRLTPKLPRERRFIYAGVVDQLVDFGDHVAPMIAHWDYPATCLYNGGHVGLGMGRKVPAFIADALDRCGMLDTSEG